MVNQRILAVRYRSPLVSIFAGVMLVLFILSARPVYSRSLTFIKDYTYRASDIDSKVSSRAIALDQVKRILLEELGTYLISETEVKNYQITKDQITTMTAGIVMTTIIDETWDGKNYYLKARIVADPTEVAKSIDALRRDSENRKELEAAQKKTEDALREVERLRKILASNKPDEARKKDYDRAIDNISANDLFYRGFASLNARNFKEAIRTFGKAIELNPTSVEAYNNRALAYNNVGLYTSALNDLNRSLSFDSRNIKTYLLRGIVMENLNPPSTPQVLPSAYGTLIVDTTTSAVARQNENNIIDNYDKAIQIDPLYADAYYYKGSYYCNHSNVPRYAAVHMGGVDYVGTIQAVDQTDPALFNKCIENLTMASKLGHKEAQKILTANNISW